MFSEEQQALENLTKARSRSGLQRLLVQPIRDAGNKANTPKRETAEEASLATDTPIRPSARFFQREEYHLVTQKIVEESRSAMLQAIEAPKSSSPASPLRSKKVSTLPPSASVLVSAAPAPSLPSSPSLPSVPTMSNIEHAKASMQELFTDLQSFYVSLSAEYPRRVAKDVPSEWLRALCASSHSIEYQLAFCSNLLNGTFEKPNPLAALFAAPAASTEIAHPKLPRKRVRSTRAWQDVNDVDWVKLPKMAWHWRFITTDATIIKRIEGQQRPLSVAYWLINKQLNHYRGYIQFNIKHRTAGMAGAPYWTILPAHSKVYENETWCRRSEGEIFSYGEKLLRPPCHKTNSSAREEQSEACANSSAKLKEKKRQSDRSEAAKKEAVHPVPAVVHTVSQNAHLPQTPPECESEETKEEKNACIFLYAKYTIQVGKAVERRQGSNPVTATTFIEIKSEDDDALGSGEAADALNAPTSDQLGQKESDDTEKTEKKKALETSCMEKEYSSSAKSSPSENTINLM